MAVAGFALLDQQITEGQVLTPRAFQVDHTPRHQMMAQERFQQWAGLLSRKGRVKKNEIVRCSRALQELLSRAAMNGAGSADGVEILNERGVGLAIPLDEGNLTRSSRQGLETQRATTGK